ncbi:TetR/AcrR family transcriptional regulator [Tepidamorphus sp. 3E244]|uniref:TetR/AcrR family transcriptional regulator n=1 Tax=Tepidamorphus sp. 3E244 TaxID=3385498 RepID=UPI0038FD086D
MSKQPRIPRGEARRRILDASFNVIRSKGYGATTVDDLCKAAGVTKGAFFHHFASKEDLGIAAAQHWAEVTGGMFAAAPHRALENPLARVLGYLDLRRNILDGRISEISCVAGTMLQEVHESHPAIRIACEHTIALHTEPITADLAAAKAMHAPDAAWSPESLAWHTQAVLQGAFILAKAKNDQAIAEQSVDHLIAYVSSLFPADAVAAARQQQTEH